LCKQKSDKAKIHKLSKIQSTTLAVRNAERPAGQDGVTGKAEVGLKKESMKEKVLDIALRLFNLSGVNADWI
jgi:hypothetical protein